MKRFTMMTLVMGMAFASMNNAVEVRSGSFGSECLNYSGMIAFITIYLSLL